MTERYHSLTVVLEADVRSDDAEALMNAIRQLRGVASVDGEVADIASHVASTRVRRELGDKLLAVLFHPKEQKT